MQTGKNVLSLLLSDTATSITSCKERQDNSLNILTTRQAQIIILQDFKITARTYLKQKHSAEVLTSFKASLHQTVTGMQ